MRSSTSTVVTTVMCVLIAAPLHTIEKPQSGHERMLRILGGIAENPPKDHFAFPIELAKRLRRELLQVRSSESKPHPFDLWELLFRLGQTEVRLGNVQLGIDHLLSAQDVLTQFEKGYSQLPDSVKGKLDPKVKQRADDLTVQTSYYLGVAHLRLGEDQNCCLRYNSEACILPIQGRGIHTKQKGSRAATGYFLEVLDHDSWRHSVQAGFSQPSSGGP